jgi:predicted nuclease of predicted toxin-antitoxin system
VAKSKKQSTSSAPPETVFFVDRDLGPRFVEVLRASGLPVEAHDDHFSPETRDEDWLRVVASRDWVILTHDAKIRYTSRAKEAIFMARARVIVLRGKAPTSEIAKSFVRTIQRIRRFLDRHEAPFIAKVYRNPEGAEKPGRIEMWIGGST